MIFEKLYSLTPFSNTIIYYDSTLFGLLIMSMMIDWIFQTNWEATTKFNNPISRGIHSCIYSTLTTICLLLPFGYSDIADIIWLILFISHFIIDERTIVIWIMRYIKRISEKDIKSLWWLNIAIDQWLHMVINFTLCVLVTFIRT